ncbi:MAG: hypothetical protein Q8O33_11030 [Pseudomonadota bacterium]|nr:hypothetical protein [Pseudomonadota bacterium]
MPRSPRFLAALALALSGFLLMVGFENIGADVRSSQLQLQFAWAAAASRDILAGWGEAGRSRVVLGLYADFLFLIGYTALLTQWLRAWRQPRRLVWGVLLAGGLDALENVFLLGFIRGGIDVALTPLVGVMSTLKFGLIGIALVYLGAGFRVSK